MFRRSYVSASNVISSPVNVLTNTVNVGPRSAALVVDEQVLILGHRKHLGKSLGR